MHNKRFFSVNVGLKGHLLYYHKYFKHSPSPSRSGALKRRAEALVGIAIKLLRMKGGIGDLEWSVN
jgi:hypothetical protein